MKIPPKLWQVIVPLAGIAAGYFGYEPIQELHSTQPDIDVEVIIPEQPPQVHSHAVPVHSHPSKDWLPQIKKAIEAHTDTYH